MPELPDITVYIEALAARILGQPLVGIRLNSPFLLRTCDPPIAAANGKAVRELQRLGKRIAIGLEDEWWLVLHLMIAGRLHWKTPGANLSGKYNLAAFDFASGTLLLSEAGAKRRAALHVLRGRQALQQHDPGGLDPMTATPGSFTLALQSENHTLKRALTDPSLFSGIGNAYSDEILHRAGLSPLAQTQKLSAQQCAALHAATVTVLGEWTVRLRDAAGGAFPEGVTAFRADMSVHGKFGKPCPVCSTLVQRIRYADNEANYCPRCQTGGKILADRSLSRLLKDSWPRHVDEL